MTQCSSPFGTGSANAVFERLRRLGLDAAGADQRRPGRLRTLAARRESAGHGPLQREQAPVWELVEAAIRAGEEYPPSFYLLLGLAGLIGAVGILTL